MTNLDKLNAAFGMTKSAIARWRTAKALKLLYDKFYPKRTVNELYENKNILTRGSALESVGSKLKPGYMDDYNLPGVAKKIQQDGVLTIAPSLNTSSPVELFRGFRNKNIFRNSGYVHATPHISVAKEYSPMMGLESEVLMRYKPRVNQLYGPDYHIESGVKGLPWQNIKPEFRGSRMHTYETPVTRANEFSGYGITQGKNQYIALPPSNSWREIFAGKHGISQPLDPAKNINSLGVLDKQNFNNNLVDGSKDLINQMHM